MTYNDINPKLKKGDTVKILKTDSFTGNLKEGEVVKVTGVGKDNINNGIVYIVETENKKKGKLFYEEDLYIKEIFDNDKFIDEMDEMEVIIDAESEFDNSITKFLTKLRDTGLINMLQSSNFIYGGKDFIDRFLKIQSLQTGGDGDYEETDDIVELKELAESSRMSIINASIKYLEKKNEPITPENVTRILPKVSNLALKWYIYSFNT